MMRKWNYWSFDWLSPMIVQALLLVALVSTWNVMEAGDIRPVPDAPPIHADVIPTEAHFGDEFTLTGWSASVETIHWP
jgi:hypothetical protein